MGGGAMYLGLRQFWVYELQGTKGSPIKEVEHCW
jgi:hypothetical protein